MTDSNSPDRSRPLSLLVEGEARRVLSEASFARTLRGSRTAGSAGSSADSARAEEAIRLYESLGFEVAADPIQPDEMGEDCDDCQLLALMKFRTIYTRRKPAG